MPRPSARPAAKLVRAAGGILWREEAGAPRLAVIHRPRHGDWSLPKGKLEDGESFPQAAVREVREETGCRARLGDFAGYALYEVKGRPKLVLFWHMAAEGSPRFRPGGEVDRLEWLAPAEALARLDHPSERRLVEAALADRLAR
ncbi:MAG TPA: NUDIX hydrolase [Anaeromyxobacteraceae bacterium]|nr:NUDIX hydrolase [Anaeromyxobacteraceae bacterium]